MKNLIELKLRVKGRFTMHAHKVDADGNIVSTRKLAEFDNLITNGGLDCLGGAGYPARACIVGTGNTPEAVTDNTMETPIAVTSTWSSNAAFTYDGSPNYAVHMKETLRFGTGVAAGNLTEVGMTRGISSSFTTTTPLFSRSLIKDGSGNPITVTVLSDEVLDVTYELIIYPPADVTGTLSMTIEGVATDFTYLIRPASVSSPNWQISPSSNVAFKASKDSFGYNTSGGVSTIGAAALTGYPSGGSNSAWGGVTPASYTNGNYYVDGTYSLTLTTGNFAIKSFVFWWWSLFFQMEITPAMTKTSSQTFDITMRLSWNRV